MIEFIASDEVWGWAILLGRVCLRLELVDQWRLDFEKSTRPHSETCSRMVHCSDLRLGYVGIGLDYL